MIKAITKADRKKNPKATKGKRYKLVSKSTGRSLAYGTKQELKNHEAAIHFYKNR